MTKTIPIFGLKFSFSFIHRWDKIAKSKSYDSRFKGYELGFFFRIYRAVSEANISDTKKWHLNMDRIFIIGLNLIVGRGWLTIHTKGKERRNGFIL